MSISLNLQWSGRRVHQASQPKITVTPEEVEPASAFLLSTGTNDLSHNVRFRYVGKTSDEIKAIRESNRRIQIAKDGAVVLPDAGCIGYLDKSGTNYIGLLLLFHNHDEAVYAAKILRRQK